MSFPFTMSPNTMARKQVNDTFAFHLKCNKRQTMLPYFLDRAVLCTQPWHLPVEETLVYQSNLPPGCFCLGKAGSRQGPGDREQQSHRKLWGASPWTTCRRKEKPCTCQTALHSSGLGTALEQENQHLHNWPLWKEEIVLPVPALWVWEMANISGKSSFKHQGSFFNYKQYWGHSFEAEVHCRLP